MQTDGGAVSLVDVPPVWLAGFIALAWAVASLAPGFELGFPWQGVLALVLLIGGIVLTGLAVWEMARARTTIVPRRVPDALVTGGIFRLSRNPIYLGDTLILTAAVLWLDTAPGLLLVPAFVWVIRRRFIEGEERGLSEKFGEEFEDWKKRVRRWL